jgi:hypothetical protein
MYAKKVLSYSKEQNKLTILNNWSILKEKSVARIRKKNPKKIMRTLNQNEIFPKKSMFSTLKALGTKNLYGGYLTEFAGSTQNHKKNIGTSNQPIKTKIFPKKVCLVP